MSQSWSALAVAAAFLGFVPPVTHPASIGAQTTVCDARSMTVHVPDNSYYNIYNATPGSNTTCVRAVPGRASFTITRTWQHGDWGYPNISSGWEWNRYSCTGGGGACFRYPVQEQHDGMPLTSAGVSMRGSGIADYDIWFNRTDAHPGQDNGAEILLWMRRPGVGMHNVVADVSIEGIRFTVLRWVAYAHGVSWNYVAYVCDNQQSNLRNFWLNGLFRDAIRRHYLSPYWWLTGIDLGDEITHGGAGSVISWSLRGVR
jgi:hypothetical protein